MSLRSQANRLATIAAAQRREVYGVEVVWQGKTYCVAATGLKESRAIEAGGFELEPDATLRIAWAIYPAFTPALGDTILIADRSVMVTGLYPQASAGELRVTVAKA